MSLELEPPIQPQPRPKSTSRKSLDWEPSSAWTPLLAGNTSRKSLDASSLQATHLGNLWKSRQHIKEIFGVPNTSKLQVRKTWQSVSKEMVAVQSSAPDRTGEHEVKPVSGKATALLDHYARLDAQIKARSSVVETMALNIATLQRRQAQLQSLQPEADLATRMTARGTLTPRINDPGRVVGPLKPQVLDHCDGSELVSQNIRSFTEAVLSSHTVPELRAELRAANLPHVGRRAELIKRLADCFDSKAADVVARVQPKDSRSPRHKKPRLSMKLPPGIPDNSMRQTPGTRQRHASVDGMCPVQSPETILGMQELRSANIGRDCVAEMTCGGRPSCVPLSMTPPQSPRSKEEDGKDFFNFPFSEGHAQSHRKSLTPEEKRRRRRTI